MLGGAIGNLIDRIFRSPGFLQGHVVDFVSVFGPNAEYFPIFNVADSAITIGGISLVVTALLGIDFDGTRIRKPKKDAKARTVPEVRRLPVPEGLTGMRVDAGLARLLGHEPDHGRHHDRRRRRAGRRHRRRPLGAAGRGQLAGDHPARAGAAAGGGRPSGSRA